MAPHDLLDAAKNLMQRPDAPFDGIWPRAAALLARQALEAAMGELWASKRQAAEMSTCTMRSQLLPQHRRPRHEGAGGDEPRQLLVRLPPPWHNIPVADTVRGSLPACPSSAPL